MTTHNNFLHSGDLGDVLYALPSIRAAGGGNLYLTHSRTSRELLTKPRFDSIAPLLRVQSYLKSVEWHIGQPITHNSELFRIHGFRREYTWGKSLVDMFADTFNLTPDANAPWLTVPSGIKFSKPHVVFSRSPRYHNPLFPWGEIFHFYQDNAIFVGLQSEWQEFAAEFGDVPWHQTADLLELAKVIAGCSLFVGNQSCPYAIAEGLKANTIQETWPTDPNCVFRRPNAQYVAGRRVVLKPLDELETHA